MNEEDIRQEAIEISRELDEEKDDRKRNPLVFIGASILVFLIILWIFPHYAVKIDPSPERIPAISEVVPDGLSIGNGSSRIDNKNDFLKFLDPNDAQIKQTADRIVMIACPNGNRICHAKAMFYFVRDNFNYVSDPPDEYVKTAKESLATAGGDCDDLAVLLSNLEQAVGITTRFVFVPNHVYVQLYLPEAAGKYREDGWVTVDATCNNCDFGEQSFRYKDSRKVFV